VRRSPSWQNPGQPALRCATADSCIESTLDAITTDLKALGGPCLTDIGADFDREFRCAHAHSLTHEFGKITLHGKKRPPEYEPPSACEVVVSIDCNGHRVMTPTPRMYFMTKSGRLVVAYSHIIVQDDALRASFRRIVEHRMKMLGEALEHTD
jgi:hypothetical protein